MNPVAHYYLWLIFVGTPCAVLLALLGAVLLLRLTRDRHPVIDTPPADAVIIDDLDPRAAWRAEIDTIVARWEQAS